MSRKMPPLTATYSGGGAAGSRLVIRRTCRSPTEPSATRSRTDLWPGSKRRLKPIMNGTPASSTAASARSTCSRSRLTGFSQKIALPACAAAMIRSTWVSVLVQIATRVDVVGGQQLLDRPDRRADRRRDALGRGRYGVRHRGHDVARDLAGQQRGVHPPDPAAADHADPADRQLRPGVDGEPRVSRLGRNSHRATHSPVSCEATMASRTLAEATASSSVASSAASPEIARTKLRASTTFVSS